MRQKSNITELMFELRDAAKQLLYSNTCETECAEKESDATISIDGKLKEFLKDNKITAIQELRLKSMILNMFPSSDEQKVMLKLKDIVKQLLYCDITLPIPWNTQYNVQELDDDISLDRELKWLLQDGKITEAQEQHIKSMVLSLFDLCDFGKEEIDYPETYNVYLKCIDYERDGDILITYYDRTKKGWGEAVFKHGRNDHYFLEQLLSNVGRIVRHSDLIKTGETSWHKIQRLSYKTKDNVMRKIDKVLEPYFLGGKNSDGYGLNISERNFYVSSDYNSYVAVREGGAGSYTLQNKSYNYKR